MAKRDVTSEIAAGFASALRGVSLPVASIIRTLEWKRPGSTVDAVARGALRVSDTNVPAKEAVGVARRSTTRA